MRRFRISGISDFLHNDNRRIPLDLTPILDLCYHTFYYIRCFVDLAVNIIGMFDCKSQSPDGSDPGRIFKI